MEISSEIFGRIAQSVNDFKLNTTTAPRDKTTKIVELRNLIYQE
jgi:hypothetical protein